MSLPPKEFTRRQRPLYLRKEAAMKRTPTPFNLGGLMNKKMKKPGANELKLPLLDETSLKAVVGGVISEKVGPDHY
jgi:hypothetical protein